MASEIVKSLKDDKNIANMDLISEHFDRCFNVLECSDNYEYSIFRHHPKFYHNSKIDSVKNLQNKRRTEFLQNLKRKRQEIIDRMRHFINDDDLFDDGNCDNITVSTSNDESSSNIEMESVQIEDSTNKNNDSVMKNVEKRTDKQKKISPKQLAKIQHRKDMRKMIAAKFMLSEWLVDIPEDFFRNWFMMCCPTGKRTLLVACNGRTKVYARNGYFLFQFKSRIPGGGRRTAQTANKKSILDCIYVESEEMFYILDVIVWNGHPFYDCDTEFRFYWIHNNIDDLLKNKVNHNMDFEMDCDADNDAVHAHRNRFQFRPLEFWPCTIDNIKQRSYGPYQFNTSIDGILFYYKEAPYTPGRTPLVCWLKVPMISKMFPECNLEVAMMQNEQLTEHCTKNDDN